MSAASLTVHETDSSSCVASKVDVYEVTGAVSGGQTWVNQPTVGGEAQLPFGGIKATGVGEKEMAEEGSNFFTYLKTVFLDYTGSRRTTNIY